MALLPKGCNPATDLVFLVFSGNGETEMMCMWQGPRILASFCAGAVIAGASLNPKSDPFALSTASEQKGDSLD